jgi:hypothetical protein
MNVCCRDKIHLNLRSALRTSAISQPDPPKNNNAPSAELLDAGGLVELSIHEEATKS